jgi:hypothetical protein
MPSEEKQQRFTIEPLMTAETDSMEVTKKTPTIPDATDDKSQRSMLKCSICHEKQVKWRCIFERCPGYKNFQFYDSCA